MAKSELKTVAEIISDILCRPGFNISVPSGQYSYDVMLVAAKASCDYRHNDPDAAAPATSFISKLKTGS
jgi:hypothetical protein